MVSFFVVTLVICVITYVIVLNLPQFKDAIALVRSNVNGMLGTSNTQGKK